MSQRRINKIVTGTTQHDGAGVKLVRVIGHSTVKEFDPFLMLDAFDSNDSADYIKGFPWHPHRGIETVTYLISGNIEHGDSLGNKGTISDGCCQWMTAGSGILHQEMPQPCPRMLGVQLWLNLPQKDKMAVPQYRDISAETIPKITEDGCTIGVISGHYKDIAGATQGDYAKMLFLDIDIKAGTTWTLPTDEAATLFVYIIEGSGWFEESDTNIISSKKAVLFTNGDKLVIRAAENGLRILLFAGHPLNEPIAWGGPIVMNTKEELQKAFQEIDAGTFIR